MSHSKRNTTRPVFTTHERHLARDSWTSSSARLTRDSFLPFGSCALCLDQARDPVSCQRGDVFCRECALSNLLAQRKEARRLNRAREAAEKEVDEVRKAEEEEAKGRAVREFERVQAGLAPERRAREASSDVAGAGGDGAGGVRGLITQGAKRKFDLDEGELERISKEDVAKARKELDDEKARKPTLPSFWTPSLTPTIDPETSLSSRKKAKESPVCPASSSTAPHVFSQKHLTSLSFTEEADASSPGAVRRLCPVCRKTLSNSSKPVAGKVCGHVFCRQCITRLVESSGRDAGAVACYVCDKSLDGGKGEDDEGKPREKRARGDLPLGVVELRSDGTGFSAAGGNKVERVSTNFQC
ncbi:related to RING finger domain protein [Cephalotrichum gorgonifer]|uniref:Related to RING finger domain protein n=1 Tax=Cephalotrichum gorgonifer TaxID=2041049 RepID=A0AAE8MY96_9PEZI|nr:related to RING finger domain protein [Cephalotrichum gorgonifer]